MSLFAILKRNARRAMRGNWGQAILILLLYLGVVAIFSVFSTVVGGVFIAQPLGSNPTASLQNAFDAFYSVLPQVIVLEVIGVIFSLMILYPLVLGIAHWNLQVVKSGSEPFSGVFHFFERARRYGRSILYSLQMIFRSTVWAIVFLAIPAVVMQVAIYFSAHFRQNGDRRLAVYAGIGIVLAFSIFLLAVFMYAAFMKRYFLTPYLLARDDSITVRSAIRQSVVQTGGYRFNLLWFELSFIGWNLLSCLFFPLFFYSWPYMNASLAMYAQYLMEKHIREDSPLPNATREFSSGSGRSLDEQTGFRDGWDIPSWPEVPDVPPEAMPDKTGWPKKLAIPYDASSSRASASDGEESENRQSKWPYDG